MGSRYSIICRKCGRKSMIDEGGGFVFHVLRCDKCGQDRVVEFTKLGEIHVRYVKGLPGPYSISTSESDKRIQDNYPGKPLTELEYHEAIESSLDKCKCGGAFTFNAPIRCFHCRSTEYDIDPDGEMLLYD